MCSLLELLTISHVFPSSRALPQVQHPSKKKAWSLSASMANLISKQRTSFGFLLKRTRKRVPERRIYLLHFFSTSSPFTGCPFLHVVWGACCYTRRQSCPGHFERTTSSHTYTPGESEDPQCWFWVPISAPFLKGAVLLLIDVLVSRLVLVLFCVRQT